MSSQAEPRTASPQTLGNKLDKVLEDNSHFVRSARACFQQFDWDGSNSLDIQEVTALIERLCLNLRLPPVDPDTVQAIFDSNDRDRDGALSLEEFAQLYRRLLLRVKQKYYPTKQFKVKREVFVGRIPLSTSQGINKIFDFKKKIGAGSFGEVHLVVEKGSGLTRVCKTINKDQAAVPLEQIEAEINVMKRLDHPHIIKIYDVYEDFYSVFIIMEHCEGGELLDRIIEAQQRSKTLTEKYVKTLMQQILNAVAYCHSQRVLHKDLKPENVLFQDTSPSSPIKVIDFGLAEIFKKSSQYSHNAAGTVLYMAPEVFQRRLHLKCDVWSAGCTMYLLLTGHLPFSGKTANEIKQKVLKEEPNYELHCRHVSSSGQDVLRRMLDKSSQSRISAVEALRHEWFCWDDSTMSECLPESITMNLLSYMRQDAVKNVIINLMAHQLNFTGPQIKLISKTFTQLDHNHDGMLTPHELATGLQNSDLKPWQINQIINSLDIDASGTISYTEFLAGCYSWRESELCIVWTAFNKLDIDGDGYLSIEELTRILVEPHEEGSSMVSSLSGMYNRADLRDVLRQMDTDGDGQVNWHDFLTFMRGVK